MKSVKLLLEQAENRKLRASFKDAHISRFLVHSDRRWSALRVIISATTHQQAYSCLP